MQHDGDGGSPPELESGVLEAIVQHAGVGVFVTAIDHRILFANRFLVGLLGFRSVAAFFSEPRSTLDFYVDAADTDRFRAGIARDGAVTGVITRLRRRDGLLIWVSESGTAILGDSGEALYYVGSLVDVTELVEARDRLAEAEESYRRMFERAREGIYRSSLDGRQLRSNPALNRLNGYDTEEEHLAAVKDIATEWYVEPGRRAEFQRLLAEHGEVHDFESEIFAHKSRRRLWISENAYLVRAEDGTPLYYEGTVRDITERRRNEAALRRAREEAERANRVKSQFLGTMSHELRTPLNAILGFSDLLRSTSVMPVDPARVSVYAEDIHASAQYLLDLVNNILDMTRLEGGYLDLDATPVDLGAAIGRAVWLVRAATTGTPVEIDACPGAEGTIVGDPTAVQQCLINILSNAVKFSPLGGRVSVWTEWADAGSDGAGSVSVFVRDDGPGIPADVLARLGEPFNKSKEPAVATTPGTGLGLAITVGLMDRMGGSIEFVPADPSGTTARLIFAGAARDVTAFSG